MIRIQKDHCTHELREAALSGAVYVHYQPVNGSVYTMDCSKVPVFSQDELTVDGGWRIASIFYKYIAPHRLFVF